MGGSLVADDFATDPGMREICATGNEDDCKYCLRQKSPRTLVLLGCSGNGKSATGNSILRKEAFISKGRAAAVTKECELKTATQPNGQIINVIDTPGLFSLFPSNESNIREILKCLHLANEGIDALLMVFSLRSRLTEEEKSVLFVLKILFGNDIANYMIIVFTNEDSLDDNNDTMKDYLDGCPDFKEILAACKNRMVLFDNRLKPSESKKDKQVQELLDLVEAVGKNNKKPFMVDLSHDTKENEPMFEEKQKKIKAMKGYYTTQEMSNWKEEAEKSPHDQLRQLVKKEVETSMKETVTMLEQKLNEEQNARLEAEERAEKLHEKSSQEIEKLKEKLKKAEEKVLKDKGGLEEKGGSCIIL